MNTTCRARMLLRTTAVIIAVLSLLPTGAKAETSGGNGAAVLKSGPATSPKDDNVTKYVAGCRKRPAKDANCDKLRKEAIEILKDDLHTLGSSASRRYFATILKIFKSDEPELRIAAADALGMIGMQDQDIPVLQFLANDPVPDVRQAVSQMISRGKGSGITLLSQRTASMRTGLTPDTVPDTKKVAMPVTPESTYLFYASDADSGRLSYVTKGMNETTGFFKGKAKRGPFKLEEFQEKYRYQLQDEEQARDTAQQVKTKQLENVKPDPTNPKAMMAYLEKIQSVQMGQTAMLFLDSYQPALFGAPAVYVLEERQIGQRAYPTRYAVLYQDQALKRPGYRLAWMTVPDDAIKAAQVASLAEEKEELARKQENEALKKRGEALQNLEKKKDAAEKKQFKKGQADLEKELGF